MKKMLLICSLYLISFSTFAAVCPPPPSGYAFSVAAWGNHSKDTDTVRCHYYRNQTQHIELSAGMPVTLSAFSGHSQWNINNNYALCNAHNMNVNDCPFS